MTGFKSLKDWSMAVRLRDSKCCLCGTSKSLVAHHIKPKSTHPELKMELSNGETLCSNCHSEHHKNNPYRGGIERKPTKRTKQIKLLDEKIASLQTENVLLKETIRINQSANDDVLRKPNADLVEHLKTIERLEQRNIETIKQKELWQNKVVTLEREMRRLKSDLVEYEKAYNKLIGKA